MSTTDVSDLRPTIVPKSDQLNSEQLLPGPITIRVTDVRTAEGREQPVVINYENGNGRPYKPCLTMRKVLILAWGHDGRDWIGKSMTLYCDPKVRFGADEVGGIRISHLSDIPKGIKVSLTATKGKKALHHIERLDVSEPPAVDHAALIKAATTVDDLKAAFGAAYKSTRATAQRADYKAAYDARMAELTAPARTFAELEHAIITCTERQVAELVMDEAGHLPADQVDELRALVEKRWAL